MYHEFEPSYFILFDLFEQDPVGAKVQVGKVFLQSCILDSLFIGRLCPPVSMHWDFDLKLVS